MTSKDNSGVHDAELDEFLQGQGALAELMRAMPQPAPTAELDAAILADAERAIKRDAQPAIKAANDPVQPFARRTSPRNFSRWQVPLGLAASFLLGILIVMQQWQGNTPSKDKTIVATASDNDIRAVPSGQSAKSVAENRPSMQSDKDAGYSQRSDTMMPAPAAPNTISSEKIGQSGELQLKSDEQSFPADLAKAKTESRSEATLVAQAPAPAAAPASAYSGAYAARESAKPATAATAQEKLVMAPQAMETARPRKQEQNEIAMADKTSERLAEPEMKESRSYRRAAPSAEVIKAESSPAPFSAGASVAPALPEDATANIGKKAKRAAAQVAVPLDVEPTAEKARIWLDRIEKLIKTDKPKEALDEWDKFRKSYPNYPVQEALQKRLESLKK